MNATIENNTDTAAEKYDRYSRNLADADIEAWHNGDTTPIEHTTFPIYCNQGYRRAVILAEVGGECLIEFGMPNGHTVLRLLRRTPWRPGVVTYADRGRYNISYRKVPIRFLQRMADTETEWTGNAVTETRWMNGYKMPNRIFSVKQRLATLTNKQK